MFKKSIVKTKVNLKIAITITVLAVLIIGSFVIATIIPSSGLGNFYAGSSGIVLPPPEPLVCCNKSLFTIGSHYEITTESNCPQKPESRQCPLPLSTVNTGSDGVISVGDNCSCNDCPVGYNLWEVGGEQGNVCCKEGETPIKIYVPLKGAYYLCKPNECEPGKTLCTADKQNICCPIIEGNPGSSCGVKGGYPYCKTDTDGCNPDTETKCGDDNLCCKKATEECKNSLAVPPYCQPKNSTSCQPGQTLCQGTGDYDQRTKCCNQGEICLRHPNGYPYCYQS